MLPWEHAAVAYLVYSLSLRASKRIPPTGTGVVVLVFGAMFPDLIDKPLSWGLGVFPTGHAMGHSVFVAGPVGVLVLALGYRRNVVRTGIAFVVGYWSHLVADVVSPLRFAEPPIPDRVLWPVVQATPYEEDLGLVRGLVYVEEILVEVRTIGSAPLVALYLLLLVIPVVLWVVDGTPGLPSRSTASSPE